MSGRTKGVISGPAAAVAAVTGRLSSGSGGARKAVARTARSVPKIGATLAGRAPRLVRTAAQTVPVGPGGGSRRDGKGRGRRLASTVEGLGTAVGIVAVGLETIQRMRTRNGRNGAPQRSGAPQAKRPSSGTRTRASTGASAKRSASSRSRPAGSRQSAGRAKSSSRNSGARASSARGASSRGSSSGASRGGSNRRSGGTSKRAASSASSAG